MDFILINWKLVNLLRHAKINFKCIISLEDVNTFCYKYKIMEKDTRL